MNMKVTATQMVFRQINLELVVFFSEMVDLTEFCDKIVAQSVEK